MNEKVLRTLEYTKIISQLVEKADSGPGKAMCAALVPTCDLAAIVYAQHQTRDALGHLLRRDRPSFFGNHDLGRTLKSLEIGHTISIPELLMIAQALENAQRVKQYGKSKNDSRADGQTPPTDTAASELDTLAAYFENLETLPAVCAEIRRCLPGEEQVADDASPALRKIRQNIARTGQKIHTQLTAMISGQARTFLQDAVITLRDNRYCIPVKSEYKNQVAGMIHDKSASGQTFFIEPAAVVNLNNQLRELELAEQEEIAIILASLAALAGAHAAALAANQDILTRLDFIFAKAGLALEQNATMPLMNEDRHIRIRKGRHPLLARETVVPIDVRLGGDFDLLVITGPNTGGKTVTLKTVGLFALMGQAGLHIPAGDRSELAVFREVYADIGDEQSIEQSLSTFSSHMTTIVDILAHADEDALCLFDELGAGTDPTEGAALAISILKHLHRRRIRTVATTHYSELKLFALATAGVENASCEFDVESLKPTFRLLIGVPGKSNAFAISAKLGLPQYIIDDAKGQIDTDEIGFEDVISDLEKSRIAAEREQLEIAAAKDEIESLREKLRRQTANIDERREQLLREAKEQARDILEEAKDYADRAIRTMQKEGLSHGIREMEQLRADLRGHIREVNEELRFRGLEPGVGKPGVGELKVGDPVRILSMGLTGSVNSLPDQKGNLFVQCGALRTHAHISDLVPTEGAGDGTMPASDRPAAMRRPSKDGGGSVDLSSAGSLSYEVSLRGLNVDDALALLEKFLDEAYLGHLPSVRIVHGKGTGTLRQAVHRYLRAQRFVKSFRLGEYGEGDAGVTVAEFHT